jgi:hypothetical protein
MSLTDIITKNRPNLSKSSVRTYNSILKNLGIALKIKDIDKKEILSNRSEIMSYLKKFPAKKRKTILASIVVLLDDGETDKEMLDVFRTVMMKDKEQADLEDDKQELSDKQRDNWLGWNEIEKVYNNLKDEVKPLWKLNNLKPSAMRRLQDFVMLSCLVLIPPRRSKDWCDFKIKNIDENTDNYLSKDKLIFNSYKTKKYYGRQQIDIKTNPLKKILKDWIQINPNDYLLYDTKGNALTPTKLTSRLYSLFSDQDKKISTSMLRHIFISDKVLPNIPELEKMKKTAEEMGHNVEEQLKYKKFTDK